jgi:hypothetical protein
MREWSMQMYKQIVEMGFEPRLLGPEPHCLSFLRMMRKYVTSIQRQVNGTPQRHSLLSLHFNPMPLAWCWVWPRFIAPGGKQWSQKPHESTGESRRIPPHHKTQTHRIQMLPCGRTKETLGSKHDLLFNSHIIPLNSQRHWSESCRTGSSDGSLC